MWIGRLLLTSSVAKYADLAADHTFERRAELPWQTTCLGKQVVLPEFRFVRLADVQIPSPLCDHTQSCNFATLGWL